MKHNSRKNKTKARKAAVKNNKSMFVKTMVEAGMNNLLGIGCFYKNDDLEKGVAFYSHPADIKGANMINDATKGLYESAMKYVKSGELTISQLIKDTFEQLDNEFVPYFKSNPDKSSEEYYKNMILTYGDIYILQELGAIKNDEYNGMAYQYGNKDLASAFSSLPKDVNFFNL